MDEDIEYRDPDEPFDLETYDVRHYFQLYALDTLTPTNIRYAWSLMMLVFSATNLLVIALLCILLIFGGQMMPRGIYSIWMHLLFGKGCLSLGHFFHAMFTLYDDKIPTEQMNQLNDWQLLYAYYRSLYHFDTTLVQCLLVVLALSRLIYAIWPFLCEIMFSWRLLYIWLIYSYVLAFGSGFMLPYGYYYDENEDYLTNLIPTYKYSSTNEQIIELHTYFYDALTLYLSPVGVILALLANIELKCQLFYKLFLRIRKREIIQRDYDPTECYFVRVSLFLSIYAMLVHFYEYFFLTCTDMCYDEDKNNFEIIVKYFFANFLDLMSAVMIPYFVLTAENVGNRFRDLIFF